MLLRIEERILNNEPTSSFIDNSVRLKNSQKIPFKELVTSMPIIQHIYKLALRIIIGEIACSIASTVNFSTGRFYPILYQLCLLMRFFFVVPNSFVIFLFRS